MRGFRRRKYKWLTAFLAVALVVSLLTPTIVRRIVRWRLQAMISAQLNARLEIGDLTYHYPYGVDVTDAALMADGPDGQPLDLMKVSHLSLKLARSPLHSGPLVIQSIIIDDPAIHLIRTRKGLIGMRLAKEEPAEQSKKKKPWKLSDMLRLQKLVLNSGQVVYEDRTLADTRRLVWKNLNVNLNTEQESVSQYGFHFLADDAPLASLDIAGTADVDSLVVKLASCDVTVNVDPKQHDSALPPEYQALLNAMNVRGRLAINTHAMFPLTDLPHSTFNSTLVLKQAMARLPQFNTNLNDLSTKLRCGDGSGRPWLRFAGLDVFTNKAGLHLTDGAVIFDPKKMTWTIRDLEGRIDSTASTPDHAHGSVEFALNASGPADSAGIKTITAELHLTPVGVSLRPPGMPLPVDQIAETELTLKDGIVQAKMLRAAFGNDVWFIKQARIDLNQLPKQIDVKDADCCITFGTPRAKYPKVIEDALATVEPAGPFFVTGSVRVALAKDVKTDYDLLLHTRGHGPTLTIDHIPIYDIDTAAEVTPAAVWIRHLNAGALRGTLALAGTMRLREPFDYDVKANVRGISLNELVRALSDPKKKPSPLFGHGSATLHATGSIPAKGDFVDALSASGEAEVKDGDFWRIPVMKSIADNSNVRSTMTVGEAAAVFTLSKGVVHVTRAAVSAPALGVEGHGYVALKGGLNVDCVTTVLGNWGEKFDVGDDGTFSRAVDRIQQTLNGVTQAAVVNIHIDGTVNNPRPHAVVAPVITRATSNFVNFLKDKTQDGNLLGFVKQEPSGTPAPAPAAH